MASRHAPAGVQAPHRHLDLSEPATYPGALAGVDVLIHAAGPFHHDPGPLVHACLERSIHYVDIAEDLGFIERVEAAAAACPDARSAVVPGCSTVPGLVALLGQRFLALQDLSSFGVFLNLGSRNPVSEGLLSGLLAPIGRPMASGGRCFRGLVSRRLDDGVVRYYGAYPIPFHEGIALGERTVPARFFTGFDRYYLDLGLQFASYVLPLLSRRQLGRLVPFILPLAHLCRRFGSEEGHLVVEGRNSAGVPLAVVEVIARREGLRLPAAPAVWAAVRLARGGQGDEHKGLLSLMDLMGWEAALQWIVNHGYEVHDSLSG